MSERRRSINSRHDLVALAIEALERRAYDKACEEMRRAKKAFDTAGHESTSDEGKPLWDAFLRAAAKLRDVERERLDQKARGRLLKSAITDAIDLERARTDSGPKP